MFSGTASSPKITIVNSTTSSPKITIVNSLAEISEDQNENVYLKKLAAIKEEYDIKVEYDINKVRDQRRVREEYDIKEEYDINKVRDQRRGMNGNGQAFLNVFSNLFKKTSYQLGKVARPLQSNSIQDLKKDHILQELEAEGLNPEPLEIILSGIANHVNECVGKLLERQKELESTASALEQDILYTIAPKINARYQSLKAIAEHSAQLSDIALLAKSTREEFDRQFASIVTVQSKLPLHLKLAESEKMTRKYPLLSQYLIASKNKAVE